jgi:hypothetical protein
VVDGAVEESFKGTNPISADSYPISAEEATFSGISGAVLEDGGQRRSAVRWMFASLRTEWEGTFDGPRQLC